MAALFAALAAAGHALGAALTRRRPAPALPGLATAVAALAPVLALAVAFPEGGTEPFDLGTLLPVLAICAAALVAVPRRVDDACAPGSPSTRLATLAVFLIPSPIGSNIARLGTLLAAPLAALLWWRRRPVLLALCAVPLALRRLAGAGVDVDGAVGRPVHQRRLLPAAPALPARAAGRAQRRLPRSRSRSPTPTGRPTAWPPSSRWPAAGSASSTAPTIGCSTTAGSPRRGYDRWLHANAIRFVALPDAALDPSADGEAALVRAGQPYLRLVMRSAHWRVYAVVRSDAARAGRGDRAGNGL